MEPLLALAAEHGLAVVEDAAQAVGARYRGQPVGSFGTGVFSLYATKNVTSVEGGVISTDDEQLADRLRVLRNQGMRDRYSYEMLGYNFRLNDVLAAIALAQLERLDAFNEARQGNAARLSAGIRTVTTPRVAPDREHVWHQYTVRVGARDRDACIRQLNEAGIGTGIFYPKLLSDLDHVRAASRPAEVPVAAGLVGEVLSLPVHPALTEADLDRIVDEVNRL
jgi:dTDP-4-amino-4,6-dideoxygalactose transaminase